MNFGQALEAMKANKSVGRTGWNGKGMHIYLEDYPPGAILGRTYAPCIVMFTAQGTHQPGWLASQPDMLAEDWEIVEHA